MWVLIFKSSHILVSSISLHSSSIPGIRPPLRHDTQKAGLGERLALDARTSIFVAGPTEQTAVDENMGDVATGVVCLINMCLPCQSNCGWSGFSNGAVYSETRDQALRRTSCVISPWLPSLVSRPQSEVGSPCRSQRCCRKRKIHVLKSYSYLKSQIYLVLIVQ